MLFLLVSHTLVNHCKTLIVSLSNRGHEVGKAYACVCIHSSQSISMSLLKVGAQYNPPIIAVVGGVLVVSCQVLWAPSSSRRQNEHVREMPLLQLWLRRSQVHVSLLCYLHGMGPTCSSFLGIQGTTAEDSPQKADTFIKESTKSFTGKKGLMSWNTIYFTVCVLDTLL